MDWVDSLEKYNHLAYKKQKMIGKYENYKSELRNQIIDFKKAQKRIDNDVFIKEILISLQKKEHERALGSYEKLLSAFLNDVLPGEREVVLDLHMERNVPAMDIFLKKGKNSPLEDALRATGGSVTNLLSIGLRAIALLKSGKRKFLVLDEADCWIKPDLIPSYASIVKQISQELGIQILIISHHDESLFEEHIPFRLNLHKLKGGMLMSDWSATSSIPQWEKDRCGIRYITLKNFQSHQHTCISLSPTVTLIQGNNDIGKSAIVNALHAVFNGDSSDICIKHYEHSANVIIDFGEEHVLNWERFKKGKVKVSYKLTNMDNQEIIHAENGTKVPDWVSEKLTIGKIEGLSVQLGQQQEPVFLLNQPASTRAKALSVGSESWYIDKMMELNKKEVQHAKFIIKESGKKIEDIRRKLEVLFNFIKQEDKELFFNKKINNHIERKKAIDKCDDIYNKWGLLKNKINTLNLLKNKKQEVRLPKSNLTKHYVLYKNWKNLNRKIEILKLIKNFNKTKEINLYDINKTYHWISLYNNWLYFENKIKILKSAQTTKTKEDLDVNPIVNINHNRQNKNNFYKFWLNNYSLYEDSHAKIATLDKQILSCNEDINKNFPVCPTCLRKWEAHN